MATRIGDEMAKQSDVDPAIQKSAKRQRNEVEGEDHEMKRSKRMIGSLSHEPNDKDEDVFPAKLMKILDDEQNWTAIRWSQDGTVFGLLQTKFEAQIMKQHFPTSRFASFVRRLSRWGFERSVRDEFPLDWIVYRHHLFRRGNAGLLKNLTSGQMYEINAFKKEIMDNSSSGSALNPALLPSNLVALGSESRVASIPRDHLSPAHSISGEWWQTKMGRVLSSRNDASNIETLRSQARHPTVLLSANTETSNLLFPPRSSQDLVVSGPSVPQNLVNGAILNNLSNNQLAQMNLQIESGRLLALLQSQGAPDTSILDTLFPTRSLTNPLLQSNIPTAFDLLQ